MILCFSGTGNSRYVADQIALLREIPHNLGGQLASEFSVRCACKFRRLTGGKSRKLQDTYGALKD